MIKAVIVDDESHCISRLTNLLALNCPDTVTLTGSFDSAGGAASGLAELAPDLVFLDIGLGELNGFDLLEQLSKLKFEVIFTTGYDHYAIKAFKFNAIDYLLKPVIGSDLVHAVSKAEQTISRREVSEKMDSLLFALKNNSTPKKIAVPTNKGLVFLDLSIIIRCQADVNYTTFYLNNEQSLTVAKTLKEISLLLGEHHFFRIHNSHVVNLNYIKSYHKGDGGHVILTDNTVLEVSQRQKDTLLKKMREL